jgi:hypothetical protein
MEPNLSALTHMEQLVFGADAKKDAQGNIIEQGHGNLHDRVKKVEAALKAAVPNIAPETLAALAQSSVLQTPISTDQVKTPDGATAAVAGAPVSGTPAPVAAATNPLAATTQTIASVIPVVPASAPAVAAPVTAPVAPVVPVTIEAVQAELPTVHPAVIAATIAAQPKATHETIVAKLKAIFASAEAAAEEIL